MLDLGDDRTRAISVTVPTGVLNRVDAKVEEWRTSFPGLSRSGLVSHALDEWLTLLEDPDYRPQLPEPRIGRTRPPARHRGQPR